MYVVYVNHPNNKAFVHHETCTCFLKRKAEELRTGYWKTGFADRDSARRFAESTGKESVRECSFCCRRNR